MKFLKFPMTACLLSVSTLCMAEKPNIIFIMADDLGWADTSNELTNQGNPSDFYETPALETMASQGMAFDNAYASGPNCAPTRAALLTGQYASRPTNNVFLVDHLNRGGNATVLEGPAQGLPSGVDAIPDESVTIAEALKTAGYITAHIGKFHVTDSGAAVTGGHGFDFNYGGRSTGGPGDYHASNETFGNRIGPELDPFAQVYTQEYVDTNIKPFSEGVRETDIDALVGTQKHVSDAMTDAAIDFMSNHGASPFFIHYSAYAVHTPIGNSQARSDLLEKYREKPNGAQDSNASFAALIEGLDQNVARLLDHLSNTPDPRNPDQTLSQNTLVVFYSDNGGRQNQSNNGPLKGQKGELSEGGVRVPMIVWSQHPNLVQSQTVNSTPVASIDFFPTFLKLAGVNNTQDYLLDGTDLTDIFSNTNNDLDRDHLFWHVPGYLIDSARNLLPQTTVRSDHWKLVYLHETDSYSFYNLASDISENNDLISSGMTDSEKQKAQEMALAMQSWLVDVEAPMPSVRATGSEIDYPSHLPGATFGFGDREDFSLDGLTTFTTTFNGVTLTITPIGDSAVFNANNNGVGVVTSLDQGGISRQRRIDGNLSTPEAIEITFDQNVILKRMEIGALNTSGQEGLQISIHSSDGSVSGALVGLGGYDGEYQINEGVLTYSPSNNQTTPLTVSFGHFDKDEILVSADETLRITSSPALDGGVLLNSIEVSTVLRGCFGPVE